MRAYLAYAATIALLLAFAAQPATAVTSFNGMGIPYITSSDFTFMQPFSGTTLVEVEFNSARACSLDVETLDIDFPSSTILPFGLADLAFPSMEQTRLQQAGYERTYFFTDTIV